MREWIGKQIARYEHAARRSQTLLWVIIAINTFVEVVWGTLPLEIILFIYAGGGIGLLIIGFISHKARVGEAIQKAQFDIEVKENWLDRTQFGSALFAKYMRMTEEELTAEIDRLSRKLKLK